MITGGRDLPLAVDRFHLRLPVGQGGALCAVGQIRETDRTSIVGAERDRPLPGVVGHGHHAPGAFSNHWAAQ